MAIQDKLRKFLTKNAVDIAQALSAIKYPGIVLSVDLTTAGIKVGASNVVKIHVTADTYIAFSDDAAIGVVSVTTSPAVLLPAGMHYVLCSGDYIRASTNPTRIELLKV